MIKLNHNLFLKKQMAHICANCSLSFCQLRYNIFQWEEDNRQDFPLHIFHNTHYKKVGDCRKCKQHNDASAFVVRNGLYIEVVLDKNIYLFTDDEEYEVIIPPYKIKEEKKYVYGEKLLCLLCASIKGKLQSLYNSETKNVEKCDDIDVLTMLRQKPRLFEHIRNGGKKGKETEEIKDTCVSFISSGYNLPTEERKETVTFNLLDGKVTVSHDSIDIELDHDITIKELQKLDSLQSEDLIHYIMEKSMSLEKKYIKEILHLSVWDKFEDAVNIIHPYIIRGDVNTLKHYPNLHWSDLVLYLFSCYTSYEFEDLKYTSDVETLLRTLSIVAKEDKENYKTVEKKLRKYEDDIALPFVVFLYKGKEI